MTLFSRWLRPYILGVGGAMGLGCAGTQSAPAVPVEAPVASPSNAASAKVHWPDISQPTDSQRDGDKDAAVVVGIEQYAKLSRIPGATDNAQDWVDYLRRSRGVPSEKVILLQNAEATEFEIEDAVKKAARQVLAGGRLWFVFIGHGAPNQGGEPLLVGYEAQLSVSGLERRSVKQADVLAWLAQSPGTPVAIFDACFSGRTTEGESLVEGLQPSMVVRSAPATGNAVVLSAAESDEFAGPLPGMSRPAFSYLALGALRGWADDNADGKVTAQEVRNYSEDTLSRFLRGQRSQSPTVSGQTDLTLASAVERPVDLKPLLAQYRHEPAAQQPTCGSGTQWDATRQRCVGVVAEECDAGFEFKQGVGCVPRASTECDAGFEFKPGQGCVPVQLADCEPGFEMQAGVGCVPKVEECPAGYEFVSGRGCVPKLTSPVVGTSANTKPPATTTLGPVDLGAVRTALFAAAAEAGKCGRAGGPTGSGKIQLTISPTTGWVTSVVLVAGPFAHTAVGDCVSQTFRRVRVPRFDGSPRSFAKGFEVKP